MPHYEEYKRIQKQQNNQQELEDFYNSVENKSLPGAEVLEMPYDAKQLMEYFEERNADPEAFAMRTKYYFGDETLAAKKVSRYRKYKNNENDVITQFNRNYTNHYAWKRKYRADDAMDSFTTMNDKIQRFKTFNGDNYQKYKKKEEIMKYRLEGMLYAAEVKSKNSAHEKYLKGRARLSCNLVLKDQLVHMIRDEHDERIKTRLQGKLEDLDNKITKAYNDLKKNTSSVEDMWRRERGINVDSVRQKKVQYTAQCGQFSDLAAAALSNLETIQTEFQAVQWPKCIVMKDAHQAELNYGETKRKRYNDRLTAANTINSPADLEACEKEAIQRFMLMELPKPDRLKEKEILKYVVENLREYYEMTKKALPYYKEKIQEDGTVRTYAQEHPEFRKKLEYAEAVNTYVDFALRSYHLIEFKDGSFGTESNNAHKFRRTNRNRRLHQSAVYGLNNREQFFRDLTQKYNNFRNDDYVAAMPELVQNLVQVKLNTRKPIRILRH